MSGFNQHHAIETRTLRNVHGNDIILFNEKEESSIYHILIEFSISGKEYAALSIEEYDGDDDVSFFQIGRNERGELELETIHDDEEWEMVSEVFDDLMYASHLKEDF